MTDIIRVNNTIVSATSCSWKFDGQPYEGITALNFSDKRERKTVHASRRDGRALGKTSGKYTVGDFSFTMLVDSFDRLTTYLTLKGLGSYGDAEWTFIGQYIEPAPGSIPITAVIDGCTVDEVSDPYSEGIDEKVVDVTCSALSITRNGKRLWSVIRGVPL
jgi:hypothetical protein